MLAAKPRTSRIKKQHDRCHTRNIREQFMTRVIALKDNYKPSRIQCEYCGSMVDPKDHVC
jgi:hypothetical protein